MEYILVQFPKCELKIISNISGTIKYIVSVVNDPKEIDEVTDSKKQTVKNYNPES